MPHIHHELLIGAPAAKVFSAITSQDGLSAWWTPHTTAEARENTVSRFAFGPTYFKDMRISVLKPDLEVEWFCIAGAEEWINTLLSFKLEEGHRRTVLAAHPEILGQIEQQESEAVTLLVFRHCNWKEYTPMYAECNYTWGQFLRSLKLFCETGRGTPWPQQHRI
jgi:hypothetical protein